MAVNSYMQRELGTIPNEWEIKELGELSQFITSGSRGWARYYSDFGPIFVRSQNIRGGHLDFSDLQCVVPPNRAEGNRTRLNRQDVLITITGNSVGNVAWVEQDLGEAYVSQHVGLVRLLDPSLAEYVCLFLTTGSPGNRQVWGSQAGQSKPGLTLKNLQEFLLALPAQAERVAITSALRDVDALMNGLERLIAKKRDLKQAAMQQLVTGRTRLPGFSVEWDVKSLGTLGTFLKGSGVSRAQAQSGALPCIRYGEIYTHHNDYIKRFHSHISPEVAAAATRLQGGDLLFAGSGETKAEIGKCVAFVDDFEAYAGGDIVILRSTAINPTFMGYLCNTEAVRIQKASLGQGDAVVHIGGRALSSICVSLPPIEEQTAIAVLLRDMDAELALLEQRLAKTRDLKQGIMQELLTGKTRLVTPEALDARTTSL